MRDRVLGRAEVEALLAGALPLHLIDCDLEGADLSGLALPGWTFETCQLRRVDWTGARLEGTVWRSCRGAFANFVGADLNEARFAACDLNNSQWRGARLGALCSNGAS